MLGNCVDNARLDYVVADLSTKESSLVTTQHINTQYGFGGGFTPTLIHQEDVATRSGSV
ncbi:MAG TPA: hypothetical protein VFA39_05940 [Steroidobacteraceae bacterium]|nr:hypothetical protein [Steroidobacteraceae bacterium]